MEPIPDFDQKPRRVKDLRTGDSTSFYIPKQKFPDLELPCDLHISTQYNKKGSKKGRKQGTTVLYDANQLYNYGSPSQRYDRSIQLFPSQIKQDGDNTIYAFCSSDSATGFWEVTVGGKDLFLEFSLNNLVIICPRPFQIGDFVEVETNANSIKWTQLQGRTTIISPAEGEGSLSPTISIIGSRTPTDPPILLIAEAEGNPGIFEFLSIDTTIRERQPRPTGWGAIADNPLLSSSCRLYPAPNNQATWDYPFYREGSTFLLQQNNSGSWQTLISTAVPVRFTPLTGVSYRVLALHTRFGQPTNIASSCVLRLPDISAQATELVWVSGSSGTLISQQYRVTSLIIEARESIPQISGVSGITRSTQYAVSSLARDAFDAMPAVSGISGVTLSRQYALSGIIAG